MLEHVTYQGVFELVADGGFSVYFPDLPGCVSYGATLTEAQRNAQDALWLHLYGMEKDGETVPAPSITPEVDPETAPGYLIQPVTVFPLLQYKGYTARPEYSAEDHIFYGTILEISDMVDFQAENAEDLENEFHKSVDDYLAFCAEIGKIPQRGRYSMKMITVPELEANLKNTLKRPRVKTFSLFGTGRWLRS